MNLTDLAISSFKPARVNSEQEFQMRVLAPSFSTYQENENAEDMGKYHVVHNLTGGSVYTAESVDEAMLYAQLLEPLLDWNFKPTAPGRIIWGENNAPTKPALKRVLTKAEFQMQALIIKACEMENGK